MKFFTLIRALVAATTWILVFIAVFHKSIKVRKKANMYCYLTIAISCLLLIIDTYIKR